MKVYALTYLGPVNEVRVELQQLLKKCPRAFFAEKSLCNFEVSANYDFELDLASSGRWRVQQLRVAA